MKVTTRIKIQTFLSDKKKFFLEKERDQGGGTEGERQSSAGSSGAQHRV